MSVLTDSNNINFDVCHYVSNISPQAAYHRCCRNHMFNYENSQGLTIINLSQTYVSQVLTNVSSASTEYWNGLKYNYRSYYKNKRRIPLLPNNAMMLLFMPELAAVA